MDEREDDIGIALDTRLKSLSIRYPDPSLSFLWDCLSFGPGIVTTEITSRLDICPATGLPSNVVDADEQRRKLCMSLASFIAECALFVPLRFINLNFHLMIISANDEKRRDAIENIEETMELDYFHKRDVLNSIACIFEASKDVKVLEVARNLWDIVMTRRILDVSPTHIKHEPHDIFRHQATDGRLHMRMVSTSFRFDLC